MQSFTDLSNSFGASFGYGSPPACSPAPSSAPTSYDGLDGSPIDLGAQAGYQLTLGRAAQMQVCPVASLSLGMGPKMSMAPASMRRARTALSASRLAR